MKQLLKKSFRKSSARRGLIFGIIILALFITGAIFFSANLYDNSQTAGVSYKKSQKVKANFALAINPASQKMAAGDTAEYETKIDFLNGFTSTGVYFSVKNLPSGVLAVFSPNPLPHQGVAVLTLKGDGLEAPGNYQFTIEAKSNDITHTQKAALLVFNEPDFKINVSPVSQNVAAGESVSYHIAVTPLNKFAQPLTLSAAGIPPNASTSFAPNPVSPDRTATLTIKTANGSPTKEYAISISAKNGNLTRKTEANLAITPSGAAWKTLRIGTTGAKNNTLRVGPARNDGVNRIYIGTVTTGRVFEFSWDGTKWSKALDIGGSPQGQEIHNMTIGAGRNDGILRIYAASIDDNLYEMSYTDLGWSQTPVGASHGDAFHAVVGDGRNDGKNRLYAARGTGAWEYAWNGSGWDELFIGNVSKGVAHGIALGDGRSDKINHLYIASTGGGVYEGTFSEGAWTLKNMGDSGDMRNVGVGPGRNDGINRVYAAMLKNGQMREFTWNGNGWTFKELTNPLGTQLVHAYVLDGRRDGVERVYTSAANGNSYEFIWNRSKWDTFKLGGGVGYMYGLHFGEGRNDGAMRLYGASFNTDVYEYSWSTP